MSKHRFTYAQKYSLWRAYDMKCFYCGMPLDFHNLTVDHVIPEYLENNPDELARILMEYEIKKDFPDFSINDYSNWVPSDGPHCNFRKGKSIFPKAFTLFSLNRIQKNLPKVAIEIARLAKNRNETRILSQLGLALEAGETSEKEVLDFLNHLKIEQIKEEPLVITFGLKIKETLEIREFPDYLSVLTHASLCDRLESELVEFLRGSTRFSFHDTEASARTGETLSVRFVFPELSLDEIQVLNPTSAEYYMPWWHLLEVSNFYQVYNVKYKDAFSK
jgi:hypothetical protein